MHKRHSNPFSLMFFCLLAIVIIVNIYSPLIVKASSDITISGRFTVNHMGKPGEITIPIQNARIDIYDEEIIQYPLIGWGHLPWPDVLLGTTYTDEDGYFSFTVNNDDGSTIMGDEKGRDIYIKVIASNGAATVRNNPALFAGTVFEHKMGTYPDLEDGEVKNLQVHPDTPSYQVAFELLTNIYKARNFVRDETGITPAKINVFYKDIFHTEEARSYYMPDSIGDYLATVPTPTLPVEYFPSQLIDFLIALGEIGPVQKGIIRDIAGIHFDDDILDSSTRYYEVIYHEYGHHVMSELFDLGPPFPHAGVHYVDEEYNPMHAWIEGWAEFYSAAAREYIGISNYLTFGGSINIEFLGYDYDDPKAWDSVEGNIAGILWDIYDSENEYFDRSSLSFSEIVSIIRGYDPVPGVDKTWPEWADHPWTIYHVFDAFRPYYNYDKLTSKVWNILSKSGIEITDTVPPQNPTSYTSSHNSVIPLNQAVIKVDVQGAYDTISGVKGYYYYWSPFVYPDINDPDNHIDYETYWKYQSGSHFEFDTLFDRDDWYLYLVACDYAGNFAEEVFVTGPFKIHEIGTLQIEGIITNSIGEIFGNAFTQVTVPTLEYPTKTYQRTKFHIFTPEMNEDPIEFTGSFDLSGKGDGKYMMEVLGLDGELSDQLHLLSLNIDNTGPNVWINIEYPKYINGEIYVTRDTEFTIGAEDLGSGVKSIEYSLNSGEWTPYSGAFKLPAHEDGSITVNARAIDNLNNLGSIMQEIVLDNSSPNAWAEIGEPKQVSGSIHVTSSTMVKINAEDYGSGLNAVYYKVYSDTAPELWTAYSDEFTLPDDDGEYIIAYKAIDNLGNAAEESIEFVSDNQGPVIQILSPPSGAALQDIVKFRIDAVDQSGVDSVKISIRGLDGISIGFDELEAEFDSADWVLEFNTWQLVDGEYLVFVSAIDGLGNSESIQTQYSVRNGAILELLPNTPNHKAGRTVPIKFTIRVNPQVDPLEPFVYNEELVIQIWADGICLQESTFGDASTDYRINTETQQYITNFKTTRTKQEYTVEIYRMDFLIDSFTFSTTK